MTEQTEEQAEYQAYVARKKALKAESFEQKLVREEEYLESQGVISYIILRKTENANRRITRELPPGVLQKVRDVPLVLQLGNVATTQQLITKYERKGWPVVACKFSAKAREEARKDDRLRDVISHCESRTLYQGAQGMATLPDPRSALQKEYGEKIKANQNDFERKKPGRPRKESVSPIRGASEAGRGEPGDL